LHLAIGTSAVAVAVNAFANLVPHARERHVRWHPALVFAAAGLAGAFAGSSIGKALDGHRLLILFALLMLFVAAMMLRGRKAGSGPAGAERPVNFWRLGPIGLGTGALSGFYGIGGGFLVVPGLILGTGMPTIAAIGSALVRGRRFRHHDGAQLCRLRTRRLANRAAVHRGRNRGWMDRRASGATALGTTPDANAIAGVHARRGVGLHAVSEPDVMAPTVPGNPGVNSTY
jgi:Sulfite exporter TauE/SafE